MSKPLLGRAQTPGSGVQTSSTVTCVVCERTDKLLRCSRCKAVFYCTKEHQRSDWKRHRDFCATHPAVRIASASKPLAAAGRNSNCELPSSKHLSVDKVPNAPVSNLARIPVSDTSWVTNVISDPYRNVKQFAGMCVSHYPFVATPYRPMFCAVVNVSSRVTDKACDINSEPIARTFARRASRDVCRLQLSFSNSAARTFPRCCARCLAIHTSVLNSTKFIVLIHYA